MIVASIIVALSSALHAGGKGVAPAVVPVKPIEVIDPSPWYIGAGVVWAKLSGCDINPTCDYEDVTYGAMVRGGYDYNQYVGVEARYINTFLDKGPDGGTPLTHIGLFLKPQYPVSERVNVYGLLGMDIQKTSGMVPDWTILIAVGDFLPVWV